MTVDLADIDRLMSGCRAKLPDQKRGLIQLKLFPEFQSRYPANPTRGVGVIRSVGGQVLRKLSIVVAII